MAVSRRYAAVALVAVALASLHLRHRPATLCLFRELTGLPCPFCGGTTAAVRLGHARLGGALQASPLAVGVLAAWPLRGALHLSSVWDSPRRRLLLTVAVLAASELYQLHRFGIVPI
jgi:hypothetical protein